MALRCRERVESTTSIPDSRTAIKPGRFGRAKIAIGDMTQTIGGLAAAASDLRDQNSSRDRRYNDRPAN